MKLKLKKNVYLQTSVLLTIGGQSMIKKSSILNLQNVYMTQKIIVEMLIYSGDYH